METQIIIDDLHEDSLPLDPEIFIGMDIAKGSDWHVWQGPFVFGIAPFDFEALYKALKDA